MTKFSSFFVIISAAYLFKRKSWSKIHVFHDLIRKVSQNNVCLSVLKKFVSIYNSSDDFFLIFLVILVLRNFEGHINFDIQDVCMHVRVKVENHSLRIGCDATQISDIVVFVIIFNIHSIYLYVAAAKACKPKSRQLQSVSYF